MQAHSFATVGILAVLTTALLVPPTYGQADDKDAMIQSLKLRLEFEKKKAEFEKKKTELAQKQQKAVNDRLKQEIDSLNKTIREREETILKLETAITQSTQRQIDDLVNRLREAPRKSPDREDPNPPPVEMQGKVEKVEGRLAQISLGTKDGLKENNTLEVYRLQPNPLYLGMLRITDVRNSTSVGRFIPATKEATLKEGDLVKSKLGGKDEPKKPVK